MAGVADLPQCIGEDIPLETFDGLLAVMDGFAATLEALLDPTQLITLLPPTPDKLFELMKPALEAGGVPSFSAKIGGFDISFKGKDFGPDAFDPKGLITLITGLITLLTKVPTLFFNGLDSTPPIPVPKIPTPEDVLDLITASLGLEGLDPPPITPDFIAKFIGCVAQIILPA